MIDLTTVEGCAVCRIPKRDHGQRWTEGVGWHTHVMPDADLIAARMRDRFDAKETT